MNKLQHYKLMRAIETAPDALRSLPLDRLAVELGKTLGASIPLGAIRAAAKMLNIKIGVKRPPLVFTPTEISVIRHALTSRDALSDDEDKVLAGIRAKLGIPNPYADDATAEK